MELPERPSPRRIRDTAVPTSQAGQAASQRQPEVISQILSEAASQGQMPLASSRVRLVSQPGRRLRFRQRAVPEFDAQGGLGWVNMTAAAFNPQLDA